MIHTELEWVVNTNVKTKQAGNSYGGFDTLLISTEEPVIHTEPKEVYLKDSDTKSMIPTYRRGQLQKPTAQGNRRCLQKRATVAGSTTRIVISDDTSL